MQGRSGYHSMDLAGWDVYRALKRTLRSLFAQSCTGLHGQHRACAVVRDLGLMHN